ncbi:protein ligase RNF126 [Seminavis robusta]|uniref:Protein ligase RNF126 n=1 Tax=Seminavis robusta TaxID=568900 RepID=A0A9N8H7E6_9STRA|nr:protein ligase RNF126 [Seminavis robusta]|eukprot:Sro126_g060670.1 protein ligase RNF126 (906) ;mRNA; r:98523-101240
MTVMTDPLTAAEEGTTTARPLDDRESESFLAFGDPSGPLFDSAMLMQIGNDDDDMDGYSAQEDVVEQETATSHQQQQNNTTTTGNHLVDTLLLRRPDPPEDPANVDLELGMPLADLDSDNEETDQTNTLDDTNHTANTDANNSTNDDDEQQPPRRRMTCRGITWQYTRFILHIVLFPVLVITSVAIPVLIVMFCFALMFVALVVLLCVYYCCSPRRGDQAAVPFHVLIRQILEAVEDETNGLGDNANDSPKLSRVEIQNTLVRRKLVHFECIDEDNQIVPDQLQMDETTREERMHQDMFPVIVNSATDPLSTQTTCAPDEDANALKNKSDTDKPAGNGGFLRRFSSSKRRRNKKKNVDVIDHNNTYELRLSQQKLVFQTDPAVNHSKHFLLKRTFVFSPPLEPQKIDNNNNNNSNNRSDHNNDANNNNRAGTGTDNNNNTNININNRPQETTNSFNLAAAMMDDSSSSGFFPVMPSSMSSSSSSSSSSEESEEDEEQNAAAAASSSDESFLLDDGSDTNNNNNNNANNDSENDNQDEPSSGVDPPVNPPPMDAFPQRPLSAPPDNVIADVLDNGIADVAADNNDDELEVNVNAVLGLVGDNNNNDDDDNAVAVDDATPTAELSTGKDEEDAPLVKAPEQANSTTETAATARVQFHELIDLVEVNGATEQRSQQKDEAEKQVDPPPETRQVEMAIETADETEPPAETVVTTNNKVLEDDEDKSLEKSEDPQDFPPVVEEAKTEISEESLIDTVPQPPMESEDDVATDAPAAKDAVDAGTDDPTSPPNPTTNTAATTTQQPEHRGISSYCNICLLEYEVGDIVVWSRRPHGCHHAWHEDCLIDWLQRKPTCPSCRQEFINTEDAQKPPDTPADEDNNSTNEENHTITPESAHAIPAAESGMSSTFLW